MIKTPGGKLRYLHIKKKGTAPKCGDCGIKLPGVSTLLSTSDAVAVVEVDSLESAIGMAQEVDLVNGD